MKNGAAINHDYRLGRLMENAEPAFNRIGNTTSMLNGQSKDGAIVSLAESSQLAVCS